MPRAAIALGSNIGDRKSHLNDAIERLRQLPETTVDSVSQIHETDPVGGPAGQEKYCNAAAVLTTTLSAEKLLAAMLDIEHSLGRDRTHGIRNAPRTIDLDLLLYENEISDQPGLTLPHPRMHERKFVLEPLAEIAGEWKHPVMKKTIRELFNQL